MRPKLVKTQNYQRFMAAMDAMEARGAEECCLVVVDGAPGLGKTTILSRWAADPDNCCIYLRAKVEWSPYWLLGELLKQMRLDPPMATKSASTRRCRRWVKELMMRGWQIAALPW